MEHDLKVDVAINRFHLETECERQAATYQYWAESRASARATVDRLEDFLKLRLAERAVEIRADRETAGIKTTEAALEAVVTMDPTVIAARERLRDARAELYTLDAAVGALDHRKSQLDNLVQLYRAGYFAMPDGGPDRRGDRVESGAREARAHLNPAKE